jgi:nicotinamidase-related amidase
MSERPSSAAGIRQHGTGRPTHNANLDGFVPDEAATALLLVDVINALEFDGAEALVEPALEAAAQIAALKRRCRRVGIPAIYANDNFGRWQSNFDELTRRYRQDGVRGAPLVRRLLPEEDDYNILKPKHSAFYATPLNLLLKHLGVANLIVTGFTTDRCVTFTAHDAYMRDYRLYVPRDCSACLDPEDHRATLASMERVLKAETAPWRELDLAALARDGAATPRCPGSRGRPSSHGDGGTEP